MESSGARLKRVRLEKGISLDEAHKKTKIHLNVLRAIEEDSLINFSPVYIKGFLKIYCKFLGVNPQDYAADSKQAAHAAADSLAGDKKEKTPKPQLLKPKRAPVKIDIKPVIAIIKPLAIPILILVVIVGLFKLGKAFSSRMPTKPHKIHKVAAPPAPKPVLKQSAKLEKKPEPVKAQPQAKAATVLPAPGNTSAAVSSSSGITLNIRPKENCWMQLKVDGKILFKGTLKKGRSESWQAKEKMELVLGNAGVVELELNGKPIMPLGRKGQAVKNIVITKDGLNILR